MRILYVEDNEVVAKIISAAITKRGHSVIHGVGWLRSHPITMLATPDRESKFVVGDDDFDAAIVDYKLLGRMDGTAIVGHITYMLEKPCAGCSSDDYFNRQLAEHGALKCVAKDKLLQQLDAVLEALCKSLPQDPHFVP